MLSSSPASFGSASGRCGPPTDARTHDPRRSREGWHVQSSGCDHATWLSAGGFPVSTARALPLVSPDVVRLETIRKPCSNPSVLQQFVRVYGARTLRSSFTTCTPMCPAATHPSSRHVDALCLFVNALDDARNHLGGGQVPGEGGGRGRGARLAASWEVARRSCRRPTRHPRPFPAWAAPCPAQPRSSWSCPAPGAS